MLNYDFTVSSSTLSALNSGVGWPISGNYRVESNNIISVIGLPRVGKSTIINALVNEQLVKVQNIFPNEDQIKVVQNRLGQLFVEYSLIGPSKIDSYRLHHNASWNQEEMDGLKNQENTTENYAVHS